MKSTKGGDLHSLHIFDGKLIFKKDMDIFGDELDKMDFSSMADGDENMIEGNGDNDNIIFFCEDGEIDVRLSAKALPVIEKLKSIIRRSRNRNTAVN